MDSWVVVGGGGIITGDAFVEMDFTVIRGSIFRWGGDDQGRGIFL
jgi:hypothetical protein